HPGNVFITHRRGNVDIGPSVGEATGPRTKTARRHIVEIQGKVASIVGDGGRISIARSRIPRTGRKVYRSGADLGYGRVVVAAIVGQTRGYTGVVNLSGTIGE